MTTAIREETQDENAIPVEAVATSQSCLIRKVDILTLCSQISMINVFLTLL